MITSKRDLKEYLLADKTALGNADKKRPQIGDLIWKYEISLRYNEYYHTVGGWSLRRFFHKIRFKVLGIICGFEIPLNCIGKGLSIAHKGPIIINGGAIIGENCRIHVGVVIGTAPGCGHVAPKIGDNVYLGPGVKVFGNIEIGSGIAVGANAVVTKSFLENNICIAGVPARKISDSGRADIERINKERYHEIDFVGHWY